MARYRTSFTTRATADEAFDYLSRFSTTEQWDPGVRSARQLTPDPVGLGSAFEVRASFLGRDVPLRYEIVDYERPARVVLRAENPAVRSTDTMTFSSADGGGTVVAYDALLEPRGIARLASPLFSVLMRKIGDRAVSGLRRHVDDLATTPSKRAGEDR